MIVGPWVGQQDWEDWELLELLEGSQHGEAPPHSGSIQHGWMQLISEVCFLMEHT